MKVTRRNLRTLISEILSNKEPERSIQIKEGILAAIERSLSMNSVSEIYTNGTSMNMLSRAKTILNNGMLSYSSASYLRTSLEKLKSHLLSMHHMEQGDFPGTDNLLNKLLSAINDALM